MTPLAPTPTTAGGALVVRVVLPLLILALWEAVTRFGSISELILPSPESVVLAFVELIRSGELRDHLLVSLKRSLAGFFLGVVLGVGSGIIMGWSRFWEHFFDLCINFLRSVPKTALAPLFIVWFGLGDSAKVLLIAFSAYFFTVIPTIEGVKNVDQLFIKSARSLRAGPWQIMRTVILPEALPSIFAGIRLSATTSLLVLLLVEIIAGNNGLGFLIEQSRGNLDIAVMFATLVVLGVLGYCLDAGMQWFGARIMPWRKGKTHSV